MFGVSGELKYHTFISFWDLQNPEPAQDKIRLRILRMAESYEGHFPCQCLICTQDDGRYCARKERIGKHCSATSRLLTNAGEIGTVLIGNSEDRFVCHNAVLGFCSEFFDAAFYGNMKEAADGVVRLPEEDKTTFEAFFGWAYSGQINSDVCPEDLWAPGDRLRSPDFSNAAMFRMFDGYNEDEAYLSTKSVDIAFTKTADGSLLQKFLIDFLNLEGPFCARMVQSKAAEGYVRDWQRLIQGGGKIASQIVRKASLINDAWLNDESSHRKLPWAEENQHKYLLPVSSRPLEDFIQGKKRSRLA